MPYTSTTTGSADLVIVARLQDQVSVELENIKRQLKTVTADTRRFGTETAREVQRADKAFRGMSQTLIKLGAALGGLYAFRLAFREIVQPAIEFDQALRQIWTITDATWDKMQKLGDELRSMAKEYGKAADEVAWGFYEIKSSGFEGADALKVLEASIKGAAAGLATVNEVADVTTSILNAWHMSADQATRVNDILFKTVDLGKVKIHDLAQEFGRLAGIAAPLGVGLVELAAAISTLTIQGVQANEAVTAIRQAVIQLAKPTKATAEVIRALGYESGAAMIRQLGFAEALARVTQYAEEHNIELTKMFTNIRAVLAVLPLATTSAATYARHQQIIANSAGKVDEAFEKMAGGVKHQIDLLKSALTDLEIAFSETIVPSLISVIDLLTEFINVIGSAVNAVKGLGQALGGVLTGGLLYKILRMLGLGAGAAGGVAIGLPIALQFKMQVEAELETPPQTVWDSIKGALTRAVGPGLAGLLAGALYSLSTGAATGIGGALAAGGPVGLATAAAAATIPIIIKLIFKAEGEGEEKKISDTIQRLRDAERDFLELHTKSITTFSDVLGKGLIDIATKSIDKSLIEKYQPLLELASKKAAEKGFTQAVNELIDGLKLTLPKPFEDSAALLAVLLKDTGAEFAKEVLAGLDLSVEDLRQKLMSVAEDWTSALTLPGFAGTTPQELSLTGPGGLDLDTQIQNFIQSLDTLGLATSEASDKVRQAWEQVIATVGTDQFKDAFETFWKLIAQANPDVRDLFSIAQDFAREAQAYPEIIQEIYDHLVDRQKLEENLATALQALGLDSSKAAEAAEWLAEALGGAEEATQHLMEAFHEMAFSSIEDIMSSIESLASSLSQGSVETVGEFLEIASTLGAIGDELETIRTILYRVGASQDLINMIEDLYQRYQGLMGGLTPEEIERENERARREAEQARREAEREALEAARQAQQAFREQFLEPISRALATGDWDGAREAIDAMARNKDALIAQAAALPDVNGQMITEADVLQLIVSAQREYLSVLRNLITVVHAAGGDIEALQRQYEAAVEAWKIPEEPPVDTWQQFVDSFQEPILQAVRTGDWEQAAESIREMARNRDQIIAHAKAIAEANNMTITETEVLEMIIQAQHNLLSAIETEIDIRKLAGEEYKKLNELLESLFAEPPAPIDPEMLWNQVLAALGDPTEAQARLEEFWNAFQKATPSVENLVAGIKELGVEVADQPEVLQFLYDQLVRVHDEYEALIPVLEFFGMSTEDAEAAAQYLADALGLAADAATSLADALRSAKIAELSQVGEDVGQLVERLKAADYETFGDWLEDLSKLQEYGSVIEGAREAMYRLGVMNEKFASQLEQLYQQYKQVTAGKTPEEIAREQERAAREAARAAEQAAREAERAAREAARRAQEAFREQFTLPIERAVATGDWMAAAMAIKAFAQNRDALMKQAEALPEVNGRTIEQSEVLQLIVSAYRKLLSTLDNQIEVMKLAGENTDALEKMKQAIEDLLDPMGILKRRLRELVEMASKQPVEAGRALRELALGTQTGMKIQADWGDLTKAVEQAVTKPLQSSAPQIAQTIYQCTGEYCEAIRTGTQQAAKNMSQAIQAIPYTDYYSCTGYGSSGSLPCGLPQNDLYMVHMKMLIQADEEYARRFFRVSHIAQEMATAMQDGVMTQAELNKIYKLAEGDLSLVADAAREVIDAFEQEIEDRELFGMETEKVTQKLEAFKRAISGTETTMQRFNAAIKKFTRDLRSTLRSSFIDLIKQAFSSLFESADNASKSLASLNVPTGYKLQRAAWGVATPGQPWQEEAAGAMGSGDWLKNWFDSLLDELIGLAAEAFGGFAWDEFIDPLIWDSFLSKVNWNTILDWLGWDTFVQPLNWRDFVASLDWLQFINPINWPDLFGSIIGSLRQWLHGWIDEIFGGAAVQLGGWIGLVIQGLGTFLGWIVDLVAALMSLGAGLGFLEGAVAVVVGALRGLGDLVTTFLQPILKALGEDWKKLQPLVKAVREAFASLKPIFQALGEVVAVGIDLMTDLFVALTPIISVVGQIASILAQILAPVIRVIAKLFEAVLRPAVAIIAGSFQVLAAILKPVGNALIWLYNWVLRPIINIGVMFANALINMFNTISDFVRTVTWGLVNLGHINPLPPLPEIPQLQEGGRVLKEGYAYLHAGEMVVPARVEPYRGGDIIFNNVTFNLPNVRDPEEFEAWIRRKNLRGTGRRVGTYAVAGR